MFNIYSSPEKFGLTTIGEIDFSSGSYEFDITVVWRKQDGTVAYADDSGCSCPCPFESDGLDDLTTASPAELQAHLEARAKQAFTDFSEQSDRWAMEIANLMNRVVNPPADGSA